ncbi:MAG: diguanylate cyclase response regulator [Hydrogenophilales bacterium CG17_big_fil_post_rev_8_21_14_2_50_63_12]|nr:MAG: diguanylate cyclase response regulator [Hydrogenophilales bacterium CG17_big_fil_post_rev_8_21_14_2_50_63_12]PIX96634.1 MAG: diguanylate cyclase response regulator [Hydrogenophilales bacterium CG_4_10_14_3_um_filter_63_21]
MNAPASVARTLEQLAIQGELPSPKGVALAILELCRREDTTLPEVARVAQADPALCGRLLRLANMASRGGRPVAAVPEAIQHLGLAAVRRLALGFSLVEHCSTGACPGFDYPRFWSHSLLMAVAMQELGSVVQAAAPDELFICGLLARIGRLGLATAYPAEYASLLADAATDDLAQREQERLGVDHNELTAALLLDWGLPKPLVESAMFHQRPDDAGFPPDSRAWRLTHLLHLAARLADLEHIVETERAGYIGKLVELAGSLGLDAETLSALTDQALLLWREWGKLLSVQTADLPAFAEMAEVKDVAATPLAAAHPLRILLVEGNIALRLPLEKLLEREGGNAVLSAGEGKLALALALQDLPQVVIVDRYLPGMDGLEFCRALRATEWGRTLYVLMMTTQVAEGALNELFDAGADDYLLKPVTARDLRVRLRAAERHVRLQMDCAEDRARLRRLTAELAIANRRLEHAALTDSLTELPNRRAAMTLLEQAWCAATRAGHSLAAMMIDIDHFKRINDAYGHATGDSVLREVAQALRATTRREDSVCRVGGEEFLVVCPDTDLKATLHFADRLRGAVQSLRIETGRGIERITISVGVAGREADMTGMEALVAAADKALYAAKHAGRNRTCLSAKGKVLCGNS